MGTKAEKKEKWLADKAAKKAAEATAAATAVAVPELTKAEKKEQWLQEREEKKAALVAAAAKKEEETKVPVAKQEEVKKAPATPTAEVKQEEKVPPAVSVSRDEDLLLTLQVIMAHDIRSTTHTKEQFLHDMEQPVVKHDETLVDVSIPYMATAKLAFEQSDQALSYEEFERKYLAESVQEVMAKQQQ